MNCHHCGTPTPRTRANKKWCGRCKVLKAILSFQKHTKKCELCTEPFWPTDRAERQCEPCLARTDLALGRSGEPMNKPCSICRTQGRGFAGAPDLNICRGCAKQAADHKRRVVIVRACADGLIELKEESR